ncbi:MAG: SRPBCC domain-containing protein [Chitinophagaceae bacterium]
MQNEKITIETIIPASKSKVWDFYTKPEHITQWNYAADTWKCSEARNDLRDGGTYFARMEAKDGSFGFDFEAIYDEVTDQEKLTYTLSDGRQSTTTFEDLGGSTKVTTTFDTEGQNDPEMQKAGWQAILDNFKKYVDAN